MRYKKINKIKVFKSLMIFIFIFGILSCGDNMSVVIEGPVKLLKNPYPQDYPSTNPQNNEIIAVLKKGDEGDVLAFSHGKDFKVYKVKMKNGKIGYLISGDNFKVIE
jgi:hypothetical protein